MRWLYLAAALALPAYACTSSGSLGGVWRGTAPPRGEANQVIFTELGGPQSVELVLGEYGPDVAGLMRFYRGQTWVSARDAAPPDAECACALVHDGRADSGHAAFTLVGCVPGSSPNQLLRLRATLDETETGLMLELQVDDKGSGLDGQKTKIQLERHGLAGDITGEALSCPVGPPGGNTASGL